MKFRLSSDFGVLEQVRSGPHNGIDLVMESGTKLRGIVEGKVIQIFDGSGDIGKGVKILGTDGREYIYGHMDKVKVALGEKIKLGKLIGTSGNTGNTTGPHLHFAVKENGQFIDPTGYRSTLDKMSGDISPADLKFWDWEGKMQLAFENKIEALKDSFVEEMWAFLQALAEVTVDLSYVVALLGGGLLIVLKVAGMERASKYFSILQVINIFIKALLGGITS